MTIRPKNIVEAAQARWRHTCPCCGVAMTTLRGKASINGRAQPRSTQSAGHDVPVWRGGSLWVYICKGCNVEQDNMTFADWAIWLERHGDRRAERVRLVADLFAEWAVVPVPRTIKTELIDKRAQWRRKA